MSLCKIHYPHLISRGIKLNFLKLPNTSANKSCIIRVTDELFNIYVFTFFTNISSKKKE